MVGERAIETAFRNCRRAREKERRTREPLLAELIEQAIIIGDEAVYADGDPYDGEGPIPDPPAMRLAVAEVARIGRSPKLTGERE
jgi:hypothetical protein